MTETLRKKCAACGLIGFAGDESCRRCGGENLDRVPLSTAAPTENFPANSRKSPLLIYFLSFVLALVVESIALLPVLGTIGMRHSANAPVGQWEIDAARLFFILHLPSALPPYLFNSIIPGNPITVLYFFVPFTQIVFWTGLFTYAARKLKF
jgi:hypothetical protein